MIHLCLIPVAAESIKPLVQLLLNRWLMSCYWCKTYCDVIVIVISDSLHVVVSLTLDGGQHGASHGQHQPQRTAQQEAIRHLKVKPAGVQQQTGAAAAADLHALLHQTGEHTWT